jgi:glycosyltransferase involved in cell wall biosynthesis
MRVLHIVESLDRGAIENWLVRMLRHARARGRVVDWTFYCLLPSPGALDKEVGALSAKVIRSPVSMERKAAFMGALRRELQSGKYDVLHCHHDLMSAVYLLAGIGLPIRSRLVHVHNADEELPTPNQLKRLLYREPMRRVCLTLADRIVGISNHTLDTFLAGRRRRAGVDVVHYYGVDPSPFERAKGDRSAFRRELGLADGARILLFAGRIVPEKNPLFAIEVLAQMRRTDPTVAAVFVGSGSLEEFVRRRVTELGLGANVRMLGWRTDVAEIMFCCDWFILSRPEHPMEGFGLAVVEAQLAGLRLLLSEGIADDPLLPSANFRRLPLAAGPKHWAEAAIDLLGEPASSRAEVLAALRQSPMDMDRALDGLLQLYE